MAKLKEYLPEAHPILGEDFEAPFLAISYRDSVTRYGVGAWYKEDEKRYAVKRVLYNNNALLGNDDFITSLIVDLADEAVTEATGIAEDFYTGATNET